ncbi:MAG: CDP-glucose 4,6-dehydratase [Anaerolineae bacterium]|nr:CDP-glucose 4,6-dehydratase [Anaerolineae bacterium]
MFSSIYQGKKVLVTGNTGFKGSWLTVWLLSLGADVYGLSDGVPSDPAMFDVLDLRHRITYFERDVSDLDAVKSVVDEVQPDFIFHLAAQPIVRTSYVDPVATLKINILGTAHILEAARQANRPCNIVMITSDKAYDNVEWVWGYRETDRLGGKDPYSASKGAAELVIKTYYHSYFKLPESKVRVVSVRAGNVVGGGDWAANRLVPDCFRQWGIGRSVEIREPEATRPWQHVMEALGGYLRLGQQLHERPELNGESYNFGPNMEENFSVRALLEALRNHWEFDSIEEPVHYVENKSFHEAGLLKLNCDKALFDLKWRTILSIDELARLTASWYFHFYRNPNCDMFALTRDQLEEYTLLAAERHAVWTDAVSK